MSERGSGRGLLIEQGFLVREAVFLDQYFLRNFGRVERPEEEGVPLEVHEVRDSRAEETLWEIRNLRYHPPRLLDRMNLDEVVWLRALLRRVILQEDWRRRFGRELKEKVRGPLYRYDPDARIRSVNPIWQARGALDRIAV